MEAVEAFLDGEWDSLSKLFSFEDSDSLLHCNTNNFLVDANLYNYNNLDHHDHHHASSFHSVSLESSSTSEIERSLFASNGASFPDDLMEEILHLKAQMLCNDEMDNADAEQQQNSSKKRPRVARQAKAKKAKRGGGGVGRSSSICSSEGDECNGNGSEESESKGSTSTSTSTAKAKNKASKSPATDAQSLYARKRRERINERLRILQNLVPNGTKVDISTMLEEAVEYVKFLQLQIKLLSSDDMWMYAPIAYNGMDMGLYQRINAPNL